jgi:hypothetical protein
MVQKVLIKLTGGDRSDALGSIGVVSAILTLAVDDSEYLAVGPTTRNKELARR